MATKEKIRCGYALGCTDEATTSLDDGTPSCGPCSLQRAITGPERQEKRKDTKKFGVFKQPLDYIPEDWPAYQCGCATDCGETISKPRGFRPGHDAKLKSRLKKEGKWEG